MHAAKRVLFGEENESGKTWAGQLLHIRCGTKVTIRLVETGGNPRRPQKPGQTVGTGWTDAVRGPAKGTDHLPPLRSDGLGRRKRINRVDVQQHDPAAQTAGNAVGRRQCRSDDGVTFFDLLAPRSGWTRLKSADRSNHHYVCTKPNTPRPAVRRPQR